MSSSRALPIAADHPAFAGHFPGTPMLPGALLLDEALRIIELERELDAVQWRIVAAKFLGVVRPGETPAIEHTAAASGMVQFTVRVGERTVLTGTLAALSAGPA